MVRVIELRYCQVLLVWARPVLHSLFARFSLYSTFIIYWITFICSLVLKISRTRFISWDEFDVLLLQELGFSFVELNASDTRSKKSLEQDVAETLRSHTLVDFLGELPAAFLASVWCDNCLLIRCAKHVVCVLTYLGGSSKSGAGNSGDVGAKHCLVMDEVDGMAGNEDRGGMQVGGSSEAATNTCFYDCLCLLISWVVFVYYL